MSLSRRALFTGTAGVCGSALLAACSSSQPTQVQTSITPSVSVSYAPAENLKGDLIWHQFAAAGEEKWVEGPQENSSAQAVPEGQNANLTKKATNTPIPVPLETMFVPTPQALRLSLAYYAACINYARMTGNTQPAEQILAANNDYGWEQLRSYEKIYKDGHWIVDGQWTITLTETSPVKNEKGLFAWDCTVKQAQGTLVDPKSNTLKQMTDFEAKQWKKIYARWDEDQSRWWVISPKDYAEGEPVPKREEERTQKPAKPNPSSTFTPKVTVVR
ncbi:MAG: DUF6318 family protein [Rothia sp. (in: high G+C Gram-positive bacteria)]|uniref:DUF6318 family protein n=1 Tax=Rothia sp. (in: high G+C Gram-positive bacteria) TaxID=1885016 RepID=UPI0026DEFCE8|nr:DUF6318 family protein [Rothia sp. (in: high G+C Gram-positive bacteria)]MDO5750965.1 DUF6318 family protein [Rothia sp. (in: high G+C Gram-positive bacteria)]